MQIKRTSSELEFATQALKEGYSLSEVQAFLGLNANASVNKVVATPTTKVVEKTTKKPTKTVAPKAKTPAPKLTKDGYFKVINLNTKDLVFVGKVKQVKKDTVVSTGGKEYAIENCTAINKATFGKLYKSLKKPAKEKAKAVSTRIPLQEWTRLNCLLANAIKPETGFGEFAKETVPLTDQDCADINKQIKSELPDLKLNVKIANKLKDLMKENPTRPASDLVDAYNEMKAQRA